VLKGALDRQIQEYSFGIALALFSLWASLCAQEWFDPARNEELKGSDRPLLEFVLRAMQETVFYAQESIDRPVICATPILIPGADLIDMIDREIEEPTNPQHPEYLGNNHIAFVLMNALKAKCACNTKS
jgi:hypothetical protein